MAFVDDVVVVRDGLALLDGSVLGSCGIRRHAVREEGWVEPKLELGAAALERPDVAEDPVAAWLYGDRLRCWLCAEGERGKHRCRENRGM